MALYIYSKYESVSRINLNVINQITLQGHESRQGYANYGASGYNFSTNGSLVTVAPGNNSTAYQLENGNRWLIMFQSTPSSAIPIMVTTFDLRDGWERGGIFQGTAVAENGTYPENGRHTDGYWYVRGSVYNPNAAPTVPGKPVATGDFKPGGAVRINWTPSTDAQGQTIKYHLERREYKNGIAGNWLDTAATNLVYIDLTLPTDATITQIEFRVRAYDTLNAYSGFSAVSDKYNLTNNKIPTINLTTIDGRTFYENETFLISGTATDADVGNVVNVKYQINSEPVRAIETKISTGADISFNRTLTLKNSRLLDGTTPVTEVLADSSQHVLKVWAEDDQGGKSPEQIRTFYVVANRAPVINVDNIADQSGMVNADTIRITGRANDPDGNEITAKYRINTGALIDLPLNNGEWIVTLPIKQLVDGNNNIAIEVTDSYNFKSTKTIRLRKDFRATELPESVQRYKIEPPRGSAKGILLWVQREESQTVEASISMADSGEQESYTPMNLSVTAPVGNGMVEDEFIYEADTARASIHLKLNITGSGSVALISGVLT